MTQILLLRESWKELFLLHLAQWSLPWDLAHVLNFEKLESLAGLHSYSSSSDTTNSSSKASKSSDGGEESPSRPVTLVEEIETIREILTKFRQLSPDSNEFGCLKAIVLFAPGWYEERRERGWWEGFSHTNVRWITVVGTAGLQDVQPVEMLQDQAQFVLGYYVGNHYSKQSATRFGKLLLMLPTLRSVSQTLIEQLFFNDIIGSDIKVQSLLWKMYSIADDVKNITRAENV